MTIPRSYLYVPGDQLEKLAKAFDRGADALIVDLEDAVAPSRKDAARQTVAQWLSDARPAGQVQVWVRVNPGEMGLEDVAAVVAPTLTGVVAAKAEKPEDLVALDAALHAAEAAAGLTSGSIAISPLLESAAAVLDALRIARGPRVRRLQLGEVDLRADIGATPGDDEQELLHVRSHVVLVSAACRLDPPVGPVSPDFRDLARLRASTEALARMGFLGRACIHPAQVAVVNEVFTPSADEVERARALVRRFDEAVAAGSGVLVDDDGRMVDEAVIRQARRVLSLAR